MALQKTVTTPQGFEAKNAYHRIEFVRISNKTNLQFNVYAYANKDAKAFFDEFLFDCKYNLDGENAITQAYAHLKTLPEFVDAIDC
jgi:hypothetical protein